MLKNREEAGELLADVLKKYKNSNAVVLAIPRGGIPVGYRIAQKLRLPFDIILSKKIGHPHHKEYAIGAVSPDSFFTDRDLGVSREYIQGEVRKIRASLKEKYRLYRGDSPPLQVDNKMVILTDDGIATGKTMLAAIKLLRKSKPSGIIVAVPVAPVDTTEIKTAVDEFICLVSPLHFSSVGSYYEDFSDVSDEDAIKMLQKKRNNRKDSVLK